jgi:hypothetical protein
MSISKTRDCLHPQLACRRVHDLNTLTRLRLHAYYRELARPTTANSPAADFTTCIPLRVYSYAPTIANSPAAEVTTAWMAPPTPPSFFFFARAAACGARAASSAASETRRQYLYFCTRKASKLSTTYERLEEQPFLLCAPLADCKGLK